MNRSANQIRPITTRNIPTLTHTLSLQSDMTCPTHWGHLGAVRCQIVVAPPRLIPRHPSFVGRRKKGVLSHPVTGLIIGCRHEQRILRRGYF